MVDHTCRKCSEASNPAIERTVSFLFPQAVSPVWSLGGALDCSTSQPVDGMGDFSLLPEEIVKDGGFLPSLTVFIKMLHKSAASLSRLSIRSYLLDLNSKYLN